ncbi:MAG: hypothetical protein SVR81_11240 [Chloroflexota bacterium]|nr:hypothetical protein [Chloroflexota bacterium]
MGYYRDGSLTYAGEVGMGFDNETLESLHDELAEIDVDQLPIDAGDPPTKEVYFMNPEKVCEVGFSQCTKADRLRHPRFNGMRRDKTARICTRKMRVRSLR